ncbi:MAG: DUF4143 domain-containing protein [Propionibacteriaceae bacterium]|jgi:predicted AAA+ superfamily ATPase|nr:DUF4143 domain-containing protein [Propionibacteriaceae bacterium]
MDTKEALGREYRPRVIDAVLQQALAASGAVVLEGARACGKTMTAMRAANSFAFMDDAQTRRLFDIAPRSLLEGATPRLLDEWQVAPELWNLVRRAVDTTTHPGQFILTGSAVPTDDITRHTGAGRFLRLRERTMSWWEKTGGRAAMVSLAGLFSGTLPKTDLATPDLGDVVEGLLRPGFPALTGLALAQSAARLRGYVDDVARTDIQRIADIRHEPAIVKHLIAALARSVASEVTYKTLTADVRVVAPSIDVETVSAYVRLLEHLFIVEAQSAWAPALRSRARVRTSPKLHLVDPALAAAALGAGPQQLTSDPATLGVLFESAVIHDLTVLASAIEGEVRHYRDSYGKEIDAVISLPDGRWGAVEVKLSGTQIPAGVESLTTVLAQIDTQAMGEPAFRLIVTGTGPTLVTTDGTITAPLAALAP